MPEGAETTMTVEREGLAYRLPVGPWSAGGQPARTLDGRAVWRAFRVAAAGRGAEAVAEGYRERLREMGFELLFDCADEGCGGFEFRHRVSLLPAPAMLVDPEAMVQLSARRDGDGDGRAIYASVLVSRVLDRIHVQTVTLAEGASPAAMAESGDAPEDADPVLPADARALRDRLAREGHVPVGGLSFETGGARLTPASDRSLDLLARILRQDAGLSLVIVGHTDNEGSLEVNLRLSRERAQAVKAALVVRGVSVEQLSAEGVGFLAPLTTNTTEEGRARNRRVELVMP